MPPRSSRATRCRRRAAPQQLLAAQLVLGCCITLASLALCAATSPRLDALRCTVADCCWSGGAGARERFCGCARGPPQQLALCAAVQCAAGAPPGVCDGYTLEPREPRLPRRSLAAAAGDAKNDSAGCICTLEYAPVCAAGRTYSNACAVRAACRTGADAQSQSCLKRAAMAADACCLVAQARCAGCTAFTPGECAAAAAAGR